MTSLKFCDPTYLNLSIPFQLLLPRLTRSVRRTSDFVQQAITRFDRWSLSVMVIIRQLRLTDRLENRSVLQRLLVLLERNDDFRPGVSVFCVSEGIGGFI